MKFKMTDWWWIPWLVCFLLSLGSGAALLVAMWSRSSLGIILALFGLLIFTIYLLLWRRLTARLKAGIRSSAWLGVRAGILATLAYDVWRFLLVKVAGFRFNPFDMLSLFGALIVGTKSNGHVVFVVGTLYHYMNGIGFSMAYTFLLGRRHWMVAIAWALILEAVMFTVYPGWINLAAAKKEFTIISLSGHIVYGAVLGLVLYRYRIKPRSKKQLAAMPEREN
jgi:hypothetical protein